MMISSFSNIILSESVAFCHHISQNQRRIEKGESFVQYYNYINSLRNRQYSNSG